MTTAMTINIPGPDKPIEVSLTYHPVDEDGKLSPDTKRMDCYLCEMD